VAEATAAQRPAAPWTRNARRIVATAASVAIAAILFATFFANRGGVQVALWFLLAAVVAAPAAAGGAIWTRILALQLLARARPVGPAALRRLHYWPRARPTGA
jgi:hypothetical protein